MIDDGNKRFYRRCDEFAICVNIGKEGYVTAESPDDRNTIFQYIVYGSCLLYTSPSPRDS